MDSQLTLVLRLSETRLVFAEDNMKNTSIFVDGAPAYTIRTPLDNKTTEIVEAASGSVLARVVRKELRPDTLALVGTDGRLGPQVRVDRWLRKGKLQNKASAYFLATRPDEQLFLRPHPQHRLALYSDVDADYDAPPIARWERTCTRSGKYQLSLLISTEHDTSEEERVGILAAFVLLELSLRLKESSHTRSLPASATSNPFIPSAPVLNALRPTKTGSRRYDVSLAYPRPPLETSSLQLSALPYRCERLGVTSKMRAREGKKPLRAGETLAPFAFHSGVLPSFPDTTQVRGRHGVPQTRQETSPALSVSGSSLSTHP
uniref:DUF6593 domain-containing protein n=1 Tax=Mycena chlorophos TaxID=658473 RepID=A0ABQ0LQ73_MYCCL|nr:predicted protein [Mycena chlorophos]